MTRIWRHSGRNATWMARSSRLLPFGGGERVCLGKALAELEIRLMAVGLLQAVELQLKPDQDLALQLIPSPTPKDGLLVHATAR